MSQNYILDVVSPGPTNSVPAHEHPILESGSASFPHGFYRIGFEMGAGKSSCVIEHDVDGAQLVKRLAEKGDAVYACVVSSPASSYRRTYTSDSPRQEIDWDIEDLGESPMFTPMVLSAKNQTLELKANRDGLHPIWDNQTIELLRGARLALGKVVHLQGSLYNLIRLYKEPNLRSGQIKVDIGAEPFQFNVGLSADLLKFLQVERDAAHYKNIMVSIVTGCLSRLREDYKDDDGEHGGHSHRALQNLAAFLDRKGLGNWTEEDFRPEKIATELFPIQVPNLEVDEDEGQES